MSFSTGSGGGSGNIASSGDVALNNPVNDQALSYDATTQKWKNQTPSVVSKSGPVKIYIQGTEPTDWQENDIWFAPSTGSTGGGGGSSTAFIEDTFTDADDVSLLDHTGDSGVTWSRLGGLSEFANLVTINGRVRSTNSLPIIMLASSIPPSANYIVEADILFPSLETGINLGVVARATGVGQNFYCLRYVHSTDTWRLDKIVDGTTTILGSHPAAATVGAMRHIALTTSGSTISAAVEGTTVITVTDSTFAAAGRAAIIGNGVSSASTGLHIDNFKATSI